MIERGVRQRCPLSPILFLIYIERFARDVNSSSLGWQCGEGGSHIRVPLLFADDMVLLGRSAREVQDMLDVCGRTASDLKMVYNEKKSAVLIFNGVEGEQRWRIQGKEIEKREQYRYLGIHFETNKEVYKTDERFIKQKAEWGRAAVQSQSLWSFDRYTIAREIWKAVYVPAITFGNAVIVHNSKFWAKIDRFAIGCRFNCARKFVEGEVGMSTMEEREVRSKLTYYAPIGELGEGRWVKLLQGVKEKMGIRTKWERRVEFGARKLGYNKKEWEMKCMGSGEVKRAVKDKLRAYGGKIWAKRGACRCIGRTLGIGE